MRFIPLKINKGKTPCDSILQFGCGPNYVLNRLKLFELMIKEQGEIFWFRFWLNFCLFPGSFDLAAIQSQWPIITTDVYITMHKQLSEGSVNDSIEYCLNAIKFLRHEVVSPTKRKKRSSKKQRSIQHEEKKLQKMFENSCKIAFGAALCAVFYEWLNADSMKTNDVYWTLPKEYLQPNYQPGPLETYIVNKWKSNLFLLLNVEETTLPWIQALLNDNQSFCNDNTKDEFRKYNDSSRYVAKISEFMEMRGNQRISLIQYADEKPNNLEFNDTKMYGKHNSKTNGRKPLKKIKSGKNLIVNYCHCCCIYANNPCTRCFKEKYQPRVCCSPSSISDHWFKR